MLFPALPAASHQCACLRAVRVDFIQNNMGRPSGEGYVEFGNEDAGRFRVILLCLFVACPLVVFLFVACAADEFVLELTVCSLCHVLVSRLAHLSSLLVLQASAEPAPLDAGRPLRRGVCVVARGAQHRYLAHSATRSVLQLVTLLLTAPDPRSPGKCGPTL